ncbi:MAG: hypothetical protein Fur0018_07340 [Anaerolineales bacterium]
MKAWTLACLLLMLSGLPGRATNIIPICAVQGNGTTSPYRGQTVTIEGLVTADFDQRPPKGFALQEPDCDSDPATSDGVFVSLGTSQDVVQPGDRVRVSGVVEEHYGLTHLAAAPADVAILSQGNVLPTPIPLTPAMNDDEMYYEAREGMLVSLAQAAVIDPTDSRAETWLLPASLGLPRLFWDDSQGYAARLVLDDRGAFALSPEGRVGDALDFEGLLTFEGGAYHLQATSAPLLYPAGGAPPQGIRPTSGRAAFAFASFNLQNLFDPYDDPATDDTVPSTAEFHRRLEKHARLIHDLLGEPAFIAVQEVENADVLHWLSARPELTHTYASLLVEGPDRRGIDLALLYRPDLVTTLDYAQEEGCTTLQDGLGPDGNGDMAHPANALTCDTDADGVLDGNRLFSRPPLVAHLQITLGDGSRLALWVIVCHWKSKMQDSAETAYTLPRRLEQAQFVGALAAAHADSPVLVLGDLNDTSGSAPLEALHAAGLFDAVETIPHAERYTYIHAGISQPLDHAFGNAAFWRGAVIRLQALHVNADMPQNFQGQAASFYRASDHDPLLGVYLAAPWQVFLPFAGR